MNNDQHDMTISDTNVEVMLRVARDKNATSGRYKRTLNQGANMPKIRDDDVKPAITPTPPNKPVKTSARRVSCLTCGGRGRTMDNRKCLTCDGRGTEEKPIDE